MIDHDRSGIAGPLGGASEDRDRPNAYWSHGHRGFCWGKAFMGATWCWPAGSRDERADLAAEMLDRGEITCECHLPPPGNRPQIYARRA